jgi:AraC-like DNA-binding protein
VTVFVEPRPADPAFFSPQVAKARRFYLDLNPRSRQGLTVICGGLEHCTADYAIHRRTFAYTSLEYVVRGRGTLRLRGRQHLLKPGSIFSYGPRVPHDIVGDPSDPLVKYFVDFVGSRARSLLTTCYPGTERVGQVFPPDCLSPLFDQMIESGGRAAGNSAALCARLLECLALKAQAATAPVERAHAPAFATYQRCKHHIEVNFLRLSSLRQIAQECQVCCDHLCRLFRRYDNLTPYQFLLRLKMNHAAAELQQPGRLVKQVAAAVGFRDEFHFSRVFRSTLGVSPAKFRTLR